MQVGVTAVFYPIVPGRSVKPDTAECRQMGSEAGRQQIVEGFAEWVAYRVLLALGQQRDAARLTRRDDLYGKGLQYFIALEQRSGQQGVLQRARQA